MLRNIVYLLVILVLVWILYRMVFIDVKTEAVLRAKVNYGEDVKAICQEEGVPYEYIMALIILESSGRKPAGSRFEPAVYDKLKKVRSGELIKYSTVTTSQIRRTSEAELKQLATSWGPLQLMGYHCYELGVPIDALHSNNSALRVGIRWCKQTYGRYLKDGDFANAFHFHNTGKPMPFFGVTTTYDPQYVFKGVRYMESF